MRRARVGKALRTGPSGTHRIQLPNLRPMMPTMSMPAQKTRKSRQQKTSRHLRRLFGSMPQSGSGAAPRPQQPFFAIAGDSAAPEAAPPSFAASAPPAGASSFFFRPHIFFGINGRSRRDG